MIALRRFLRCFDARAFAAGLSGIGALFMRPMSVRTLRSGETVEVAWRRTGERLTSATPAEP